MKNLRKLTNSELKKIYGKGSVRKEKSLAAMLLNQTFLLIGLVNRKRLDAESKKQQKRLSEFLKATSLINR